MDFSGLAAMREAIVYF